jgi:hypothetical protein
MPVTQRAVSTTMLILPQNKERPYNILETRNVAGKFPLSTNC